jgi:5-formyltetrahydrofolate cyclo-ligase
MEKAEARRQVESALARLSQSECSDFSWRIRERLIALPEVVASASVMAYLPMEDEVDTRRFLSDLLALGKRVYVPRTHVAERRMTPIRLTTLEALVEGEYGVAEPRSNESCAPEEIDFILVPARAFDLKGNRLGRGAGFYDRFMASEAFRAVRCGASFSCQVLDAVPCEGHDLPVQILVTEEGVTRCDCG